MRFSRHILKPSKVILLLRIDISAGRQQMSGIFRFIREGYPWNVRLMHPAEFTPAAFREAVKDKISGIISSENNLQQIAVPLARARIPVAIMDPYISFPPDCAPPTAFVSIDDAMIGKTAANHLLSCGKFRSYAFVPDRLHSPWALRREATFAATVKTMAEHYSVFPSRNFKTEAEDRRNLVKWLQDLPKPAAIMAACDYRAVTVIEACNETRIEIPSSVSLVSVDNDELYGDNLAPSLTSVEPDFEKEGYIAASMLQKMLKTRKAVEKPCLSPVRRIVVRESTSSSPPVAHLIQNALNFIKNNALSGIRVPDVVAHMHCSRRLADMRFREFHKQSIRHTIEQRKLAEVMRLIATTDDTFSKIARRCGFASLKNLEKVFRKRVGQSLSCWEAENRQP